VSRRDDGWGKYGSPYDPGYSGKGKIEREQDQRRNEDQYSIRGCGDPFCTMCNSHIPTEVARTMSRDPEMLRRIIRDDSRSRL
jgi:hypothetical protein